MPLLSRFAAPIFMAAFALSAPLARAQAPAPPAAPKASEAAEIKIPQLGAAVTVILDKFGIPHIYADSVEDAYRALGYLHSKERLWQLELYRRRSTGRLAELVGPGGVDSDILMRRLGIRQTSEEVLKSDLLGADLKRGLDAYAEGVNARLAELTADDLPAPLKMLDIKPEPWTPVESLSWLKYMGWDQGGTDTDLWFGMMVEKLGWEAANELWPVERPYEEPVIPHYDPAAAYAKVKAAGAAPTSGRNVKLASGAGLSFDQCVELSRRIVAGRYHDNEAPFGSNNWVVSGAKSASGKPILCNDPHLGFGIPMIWYMAHMVAPGLDVVGVTFPGAPFVIIGHNDRIAWGFTNMQADAVDYFIEKVDPDNPNRYLHKGEWKEMTTRTEKLGVMGEAPREVVIRSTVHGPVDTVGDATVALQWTGLRLTMEARAIFQFNSARGLPDFLDALKYLDVPAMNVVYADVEGNIAIAPHGDLPIRASGQGRIPADGSTGEYDWVGLIPRQELPFSINPPEGYLASANGRPQPPNYPYYLGWMWDSSYRTRRIHEVLGGKDKHSVEDMTTLQNDVLDKCAQALIPSLLSAWDKTTQGDEFTRACLDKLRNWNFVCSPDQIGPSIYTAWLAQYRRAVWADEWTSRKIEQPGGSWGFAGENDRDPEMEVLERMTRSIPESVWFDDKTTPERENRDAILRSSFAKTLAALKEKLGPDPEKWVWGEINKLRVGPLLPDPKLARGGMPVGGGPYTVNPGGSGDGVRAGASFRMIVDMADPAAAIGVYPGGQSENPESPHYDDMIPLFASGKYVSMKFHPRAADFPAEDVTGRLTFASK